MLIVAPVKGLVELAFFVILKIFGKGLLLGVNDSNRSARGDSMSMLPLRP